jgi:hypothetical protein
MAGRLEDETICPTGSESGNGRYRGAIEIP